MIKKVILSLITALSLTVSCFGTVWAEEELFDDLEQLEIQKYTDNTADINLGGGWKTNSAMGGGKSAIEVASGVTGADGKCFRIGAKSTSGSYGDYSGVVYDGKNALTGENTDIEFRFMLSSVNVEAGVRFACRGDSFYELILPKKGDTLAVLNKSVNGNRVTLLSVGGEKNMKKNTWYKMHVSLSHDGKISWSVTDGTEAELSPSPNGTYCDIVPITVGEKCSFELIAGGYSSGYAYFDDISFKSEDLIYDFCEDFEETEKVSYSGVADDDKSETGIIETSGNKAIGNVWTTNSVMGYDGKAYAGIVSKGVGADGVCIALSARAAWNDYHLYPGIVYNGADIPCSEKQLISFKFRAKDGKYGGGGAGIRFLKSGDDFYELVFPRSDSGKRVILNKISDGIRETVYTLPWAAGCRNSDLWYSVEITAERTGRISWNVARCDGTAISEGCSMSGEWVDDSLISANKSGIELIAGGYRCAVTYFDDIKVKCFGNLNNKQSFADEFETKSASANKINGKINENWRYMSANPGFNGNAGASIDDGGTIGKGLFIEAQAQFGAYGVYPTVLYTGKYPTARGIEISVDIKTETALIGGGVRFMISGDQKSYYELYFPGKNHNSENVSAVLTKVTADGRTELQNFTADEFPMLGANTVYRLRISACGGQIDYSLKTADGVTAISGSAADSDMPLEYGKVGLFAAGQRDKYVCFDNFAVSSFCTYTETSSEPENVIYRNVICGIEPNGGIYDLGGEYMVNKITAADGTYVKLSKDGENFVSIGSVKDGSLLNRITNRAYRYVMLTNTDGAKVWTEVGKHEIIRKNTYAEFSARLNGTDGKCALTSSADALLISGNTASAVKNFDGYINMEASEGNSRTNVKIRISSPLETRVDGDKLYGSIALPDDCLENSAVVVKYIGADGYVVKTVYADAARSGNVIDFETEYRADAAKISVTPIDRTVPLSAPYGEYWIR